MREKRNKLQYLGLIATLVIFASCKQNRLDIDVSEINISLSVNRFDKVMFDGDPSEVRNKLMEKYPQHSNFIDLYTKNILRIGPLTGKSFDAYLNSFLSDTIIRKTADTVAAHFDNFTSIEKELTSGFKHYHYYFPGEKIPSVYTYISGFNESLVVADGLIGVSLDKYLGRNCMFYKYLGIPRYKIKNMIPEKIVPDLFYVWALSEYPMENSVDNLLSNMIYQGKLIYFTEAMNPGLPDSLLIGYSGKKLEWCKKNEAAMWSYLVEKKLLYSVERLDLQKFIADAPFTNVFTEQSPGRTGVWLGWQIVKSFMNNHKEISLAQLMKINNAQEILNQSKYYPE